MQNSMNYAKDQFLRIISQLIPLSHEQKELLLKLPIFQSYSKGTFLFERGARTNLYYFVIQGGIRIYRLVDGKEISLHFVMDHEAFFPVSTVLQKPAESYALCFEDTVLVALTEEQQQEIEEQIPLFQQICRKFSEKLLAKNQERQERYKTLSPEQSYQQLVKDRPELIQRVPQYHIATYLGIRPESLSRIRSRINHTKNYS